MPVLIYAFYRVNTHYKNVAEQLRLEDGAQLHEFDGNTVIVLVGNVTKANVGALNYARSIGDYVVAMHVSMDENVEKEKEIQEEFKNTSRTFVYQLSILRIVHCKILSYVMLIWLVKMPRSITTVQQF